MVNKTIFFSALAALLLMGAGPVLADDEAAPPVEAADEPAEVEVGAEEAAAAAAKSDEALAVPTSEPIAESPPAEQIADEKPTAAQGTTEESVAVKPADPKPAEVKPTEVKKAPAKKKSEVAKKHSKKKTKSAKASTKPKLAAPVVAKAERRPSVKRTGQTRPLSDFELGRYQYCGSDRDCVAANNGCCDCANGGADVAVNRERLAAFEARFDCLYVSCTEKGAMPPCGSGIISCVNHKCVYFSNGALEEKF